MSYIIEQALIHGALPSLYISYTTIPYIVSLSCMHQGDIGVCGIHAISFPKTFNTTKEKCMPFEYNGTILTKYTNLTGKIPTANPPPFSNICPRYARWY